ncbi:MAG TPA: hypothetical protein VNR42_11395 [Solirubrobacteraceae bacterium]|nr:hypothetical protein [Solirubrobacteraceae bacterium]
MEDDLTEMVNRAIVGLVADHEFTDAAAAALAAGVDAPVADTVTPMATAAPSESTPQRLAAIREQMKLLSDYL